MKVSFTIKPEALTVDKDHAEHCPDCCPMLLSLIGGNCFCKISNERLTKYGREGGEPQRFACDGCQVAYREQAQAMLKSSLPLIQPNENVEAPAGRLVREGGNYEM